MVLFLPDPLCRDDVFVDVGLVVGVDHNESLSKCKAIGCAGPCTTVISEVRSMPGTRPSCVMAMTMKPCVEGKDDVSSSIWCSELGHRARWEVLLV